MALLLIFLSQRTALSLNFIFSWRSQSNFQVLLIIILVQLALHLLHPHLMSSCFSPLLRAYHPIKKSIFVNTLKSFKIASQDRFQTLWNHWSYQDYITNQSLLKFLAFSPLLWFLPFLSLLRFLALLLPALTTFRYFEHFILLFDRVHFTFISIFIQTHLIITNDYPQAHLS